MSSPECAVCGPVDAGSTLLRKCPHCGRSHCPDHLLPENHGCTATLVSDIEGWKAYQERFGGQGKTLKGSESPDPEAEPPEGGATERRPKRMGANDWGAPAEEVPESDDRETTGSAGNERDYEDPGRLYGGDDLGADGQSDSAGHAFSPPWSADVAAPVSAEWLLVGPRAMWRHRRSVVTLVLAAAVAIAFGPVSAAEYIGRPAEPVDASLKGAADWLSQAGAGVLAALNNTTSDGGPTTTENELAGASTLTEAGGGAGASTPTGAQATKSEPSSFDQSISDSVHEQVNSERSERGLSELDRDSRLSEIAWGHSRDMAVNGYFSHTSPDGETRESRYEEAGYDCRVSIGDGMYLTGGENLYRMSYSGVTYGPAEIAEQVVAGWMTSEGHRENLLEPAWENEGIGVYTLREGGEVEVYVTQNFC